MVIDKRIIKEFENASRKSLPEDLKKYLLSKYALEPFPYKFSEQDLYANIESDISAYEAGNLNVTVKKPSEQWQEEREYLHSMYIEKCREICNLEEYINKLELVLLENGLKPSGKVSKQIDY